ncbi:hypothetical protein BKA80DRAFT_277189 [Phyllosticta citrichinensis]
MDLNRARAVEYPLSSGKSVLTTSVLRRSLANRSMLRTASSLVLRGSLRTRIVRVYLVSGLLMDDSSSGSAKSGEVPFSRDLRSPMGERVYPWDKGAAVAEKTSAAMVVVVVVEKGNFGGDEPLNGALRKGFGDRCDGLVLADGGPAAMSVFVLSAAVVGCARSKK